MEIAVHNRLSTQNIYVYIESGLGELRNTRLEPTAICSSRRVSFYPSVGFSQPVKMSLLFCSKSVHVPLEVRFGAEMARAKRALKHRFFWFFHVESPRQSLEPVHLSIVQEQRLAHYLRPWTAELEDSSRRFFHKRNMFVVSFVLWMRKEKGTIGERGRERGERKENLLPRSSEGETLSSTI